MKIDKWCYEIKPGDYVTSGYRRRWSGVVLKVEQRKDQEPLLTVRKMLDQHGNPIRRGMQLKRNVLSAGWVEPVTPTVREKLHNALAQLPLPKRWWPRRSTKQRTRYSR